jgi:hypothetical protein
LGRFTTLAPAWVRPRDRIPTATIISGLDISDIKQGSLGDCYFLASAAAVGEFEKRLSDSFVTKNATKEGIVVIQGFVLGLRRNMTIDDYLPFYNVASTSGYYKLPYFAQLSPQQELWAPYLEKLFAKVNGNYEVIEGGWSTEAMRFLTGAPSATYYLTSFSAATIANDVWNLVVPADAAKLVITAGTPSATGGDSTNNVVGLAMNHAYTIVGAYTLKNADGSQKARLFRIRNPWGSDGAYNGTWRDSDPVWATTGQTYKT